MKARNLLDQCSTLRAHLTLMGFAGGSDGKESACNVRDLGSIPGSGRFLEKGMATHFSILAWRISWTEEPGGLQSMEPQRVKHHGATNTFFHIFTMKYINITTNNRH